MNTLHLGLSYNCNMRCKHCFVDKQHDKLNINKLKEAIDYLDQQGLFFVIYTFGEPLLAKEFWNISKFVSSKNIVQTIMTNGYLINSEIIPKLKDHGINNIYVSLDSIDEIKHDRNRNLKGSYKKALKSLELLVDNRFNVGIAVTINDSNILDMEKFVDLAKKIGVKNISFLRQRNNSRLINLKYIKEYEKFYKKYICGNKKINILFHDPSLLKITRELYKQEKIDRNTYEKYMDMNMCHYKSTISIEPNGNIKHCNLINDRMGNLNEESIKKIIEKGSEDNECFGYCTELSK